MNCCHWSSYTKLWAAAGNSHDSQWSSICVRGGRTFANWPQAAKDFEQLEQTKLAMPLLSIGGEKANGEALGKQAKLVATDATVMVFKDTGHWPMEESPKETMDALVRFFITVTKFDRSL